jgi:hypothetical protein
MRLGMRKMLLLGAGLAVAGSGYAFLAGNTLATAGAGSGTGTVSGYTISNVDTNPAGGAVGAVANYVVTFDAVPNSQDGENPAMNASISFSGYGGTPTSQTFACAYNGLVNGTTNVSQFYCDINATSKTLDGLNFNTIDNYTVTATA